MLSPLRDLGEAVPASSVLSDPLWLLQQCTQGSPQNSELHPQSSGA